MNEQANHVNIPGGGNKCEGETDRDRDWQRERLTEREIDRERLRERQERQEIQERLTERGWERDERERVKRDKRDKRETDRGWERETRETRERDKKRQLERHRERHTQIERQRRDQIYAWRSTHQFVTFPCVALRCTVQLRKAVWKTSNLQLSKLHWKRSDNVHIDVNYRTVLNYCVSSKKLLCIGNGHSLSGRFILWRRCHQTLGIWSHQSSGYSASYCEVLVITTHANIELLIPFKARW